MRIVGESYFTLVGTFYSTQTFFMRIAMELCSGVRMEYSEGFFREFSLTQLITQKSSFLFFVFYTEY
jgi:hypothetical protein